MEVDWQKLLKEDEGFDEYLKEYSYFMYLAQAKVALPFIYAHYQKGVSALALVRLTQIMKSMQQ